MRELVEETNTQYEVWAQVNEQLRATPSPLPSFMVGDIFWALTQHMPAGDPKATDLMRAVLAVAKQNVAQQVGLVMNEQVRILWLDLQPLWGDKLGSGLLRSGMRPLCRPSRATSYTRFTQATKMPCLWLGAPCHRRGSQTVRDVAGLMSLSRM